jgi:hypothetical protein
MKELYTETNPYTGIPMADDPAVGNIIIQTEDGMFFWTMQKVEGKQREILRGLYADWLEQKYGTLENAFKAWNNSEHKNDNIKDHQVGIWKVWYLTTAGMNHLTPDDGMKQRLADQTAFYTETQRNFNAEMRRFYREELGMKCLIVSGNWKTADQFRLLDAERYSYTPNEIIAVQRYCGPVHINPTAKRMAGYSFHKEDCFTLFSALLDPLKLPIFVRQVEGHPFMVTESTWVSPTPYQSEGPFLLAAYQCLSGVDSYNYFAFSQLEWDLTMTKFQVGNPSVLGSFPAAALVCRKGYLKQADPVVHEYRTVEEIYRREMPLVYEGGGFDPIRDKGDEEQRPLAEGEVHELAYLAGPVHVSYNENTRPDYIDDLASCIDRKAMKVRSATGELEWDYGRGICTMNAPMAQGAAGFLGKAGTVDLDAVSIETGNEYITVMTVPLDDRPIAESGRLLVQAVTLCRPYGWRTEDTVFKGNTGDKEYAGRKILSKGGPPWNVVDTDLTVTVETDRLTHAYALDANGMKKAEITPEYLISPRRIRIRMPEDAMYVVLTE